MKQTPRERKKATWNWTSKLCETGNKKIMASKKKFEFSIILSNAKRRKKQTMNTIKVLKKMRKKQFESHTSHNSLSSIPYRSNDFGPGTELALKQYSVFQEATHSMSFSTLSFIVGVATIMVQATPFASVSSAAASVIFMPAMPPRPNPYPALAHCPAPSSPSSF